MISLRVVKASVAEKKYNPDQPRHPAGDARGGQWAPDGGGASNASRPDYGYYGEWSVDEKTGRRWNTMTNDPDAYHPSIKKEYDDLPAALRDAVRPPTVEHAPGETGSFVMGAIRLDTTRPGPRTGEIFVHEFAHYADYRLDEISSSPAFVQAFNEAKAIAQTREAQAPRNSSGSAWESAQQVDYMTVALAAGKNRNVFSMHDETYFARITNADRKEAYALTFQYYVYYNPSVFRAYPSLHEYAKAHFEKNARRPA